MTAKFQTRFVTLLALPVAVMPADSQVPGIHPEIIGDTTGGPFQRTADFGLWNRRPRLSFSGCVTFFSTPLDTGTTSGPRHGFAYRSAAVWAGASMAGVIAMTAHEVAAAEMNWLRPCGNPVSR